MEGEKNGVGISRYIIRPFLLEVEEADFVAARVPLTPPPPPKPFFNIDGFARIFVHTGICRSAALALNLKTRVSEAEDG